MNGAQIHLALNHLPVIGTLIATLLLAAALVVKSGAVRRAALLLFAAAGLAAGAAFLTGEPAEDVAENLPGVQKAMIHDHEEAAEAALIGTAIIAVLALGAVLVERRRTVPRWVAVAILVGGVGASGGMAWAAHLGGLIRHPELRPGFVASAEQS
ncbi:MAG: hypothetical protein HY275_08815 [Gemmatimonadetes bacterium]|nr:hypothetical protein [Gemmatimonadota bacterium]